MKRDDLKDMKLEALRTLAAERGLEGARTMTKAELVDALAAPAAKPREEKPTKQPAAPAARATKTEPMRSPSRGGFDVPSSTVHPHAPQDQKDKELLSALAEARNHRHTGAREETPAPPPSSEPLGMLDLEELPETYGTDECEVLYKDPAWVFVYWEVTDGGIAAAREQLGAAGAAARLVMRLFSSPSGDHGREVQDLDLTWNHGRRYIAAPHPGEHLRVAVGLLSPEGYFAPIAHSSVVRVPPNQPGPEGPVEWMEVIPARTRGREREPLVIVGRGQDHAERGVRESTRGEDGGTSPRKWGKDAGPGVGSGSGRSR